MGILDGYQSQASGSGLLDYLRAIQPGGGLMMQPPATGFPQEPEISSQSRQPQMQPQQMQPQATPQPTQMPQQEPSMGDRLMAGFQGFARGPGLLPAIAGAMRGASEGPMENQTARALVANGLDPELAKVVVRDPAMLRAVLPHVMGVAGKTDDIKEFEYAKKQGFTGSLTDWMARKRAGAGEYGLNPIWGTGPDGNPTILQLGKSGEAIQSKIPEGVKVGKDVVKIDAGTETILLDPVTRQPIGRISKNIAESKTQAEVGKGLGEAKVSLESIRSKMPGLEKVVGQLEALADKATFTLTGQAIDFGRRQIGAEPRESAIARAEYISMVDNQVLPLLRDTFGAAFTEREGQSLKATLGDPDKSPAEKKAVLRSFIEQKRRDVEALERRVNPQAPARPASSAPSIDDLVKKYSK